jgi:hypothetical protein
MSDFFESAKNLVNSAMSRTGWEAQKQMRVRGKQSEIDKLLEQRQRLMEELGQVAMTLYQQGSLTDTQLSRLCASIFELDHDLRTREGQMQDIKNESYPTEQFTSGPTTNYAPPSSSPNNPNSANAPYGNPAPGGAASYAGTPNQNPNVAPGPGGQGAQAGVRCPQCGSPLRPGAIYCRNCGAKTS